MKYNYEKSLQSEREKLNQLVDKALENGITYIQNICHYETIKEGERTDNAKKREPGRIFLSV